MGGLLFFTVLGAVLAISSVRCYFLVLVMLTRAKFSPEKHVHACKFRKL
jgi:hypothetical protein